MFTRERLYILLLVSAVVLVVGLEALAPEPVDWTDSFEAGETRPYASTVVREALPSLFPGAPVETVDLPPYLHLRDDSTRGGAYLFVTKTFAPDAFETDRLLDYAARGNTLFVAAHDFEGTFGDTLKVNTSPLNLDLGLSPQALPLLSSVGDSLDADSSAARLTLRADVLDDPAIARRDVDDYVFVGIDSARTQPLGRVAAGDEEARLSFVRVPFGEGAILLNSTPRVFTNYHALHDRSAPYVWAALSHVPNRGGPVWWDAHHKPGSTDAQTPFRFVLSEPALRRAYYTLLAGAMLFLLFMGRRRQRVIPVVEPPSNETVGFVKTVGRLAYRDGRPLDVAQQRITYWLASLRHRLGLSTDALDDAWVEQVAARTGVPEEDVRAVVDAIHDVRARDEDGARFSDDALRTLNRRIETFERESVR